MDDDKTYLICSQVPSLPDNRRGNCAECHTPIVFRPHAAERADFTKVCIPCAKKLGVFEVQPRITSETAKELRAMGHDFLAEMFEVVEEKH